MQVLMHLLTTVAGACAVVCVNTDATIGGIVASRTAC